MRVLHFLIPSDEAGKTVEAVLRRRGISSRLMTDLKKYPEGLQKNGAHIRTCDTVAAGDTLTLVIRELAATDIPPSSVPVPVLYESEDAVVFNKPPHMPVHRSKNHQLDTLENVFAARYPGLVFRAVNRLDRDTSGCVVVAKNPFAAKALTGGVTKCYLAVVEGRLTLVCGTAELPVWRPDPHRTERTVDSRGQYARTDWQVLKAGKRHSFVRCTLFTGRTHQIRVHMAHLGHPLAGDDMYGGSREQIGRQALHCAVVEFCDPADASAVRLCAPMPEDMQKMIKYYL